MARPLRIEFPGAIYHVTSRGDRREAIFDDDTDREALLQVLDRTLTRFDGCVFAYCLMDNHYHLVLHTRRANLSRIMRDVNGIYTQAYNHRHGTVGHLFQGRFKAILVDRDAYLLEVCRYVELNPVRAAMVGDPGGWPWSSYRALTGAAAVPPWLDAAAVHGSLLGHEVTTAAERRRARRRYTAFVAEGQVRGYGRRRCASRSTWATRRSCSVCKRTSNRQDAVRPRFPGRSAPRGQERWRSISRPPKPGRRYRAGPPRRRP